MSGLSAENHLLQVRTFFAAVLASLEGAEFASLFLSKVGLWDLQGVIGRSVRVVVSGVRVVFLGIKVCTPFLKF